jgi:hypothetical protein
MSGMTPPEIDDAVGRLCDGCLAEPQRLALMEALRTSKAARDAYIRHVSLHFWLRGTLYRGQDLDVAPAVTARTIRVPAPASGGAASRWVAVASIVAAVVPVVILGALVGRDGGRQVPPPMAAVVVRAVGCRWTDEHRRSVGDVIRSGDLVVLESGTLNLLFDSCTHVAAQGPVAFQVVSPSECDLDRGELMVRVLHGGRGFRVTAGTLHVIDRGTRFGVRRPSAGEAEVEVFEGKVALCDSQGDFPAEGDAEAPLLRAGQTAAVTLGSRTRAQVVRVGAALSAAFATAIDMTADEQVDVVFDGFSQAGPDGRIDKATGGAGWASTWLESRERADTASWVVSDGAATNDRDGAGGAVRGVRLAIGPSQPVYASATLQLASGDPGLPSLVWLTLFQAPPQFAPGKSILRAGFGISAREYFCGFGSRDAPVGRFHDDRPRGGFGAYRTGQSTRMVGKIEIDVRGPADRLSVWIDPPRGAREADAAPASVSTGSFEGGLIDKIVLRFSCSGNATRASVDDVRLGHSWSSVAD